MKIHPFAEIFPLLDGPALEELTEDIKTHGLREPIITFRGAILDGRNRFIACQKANVKPTFTVYTGDEKSALAWVVSANIHRRHLTVEQRAFAASRIAALREGANQHSSGKIGSNDEPAPRGASSKSQESPSQAEAAEKLGVSRRSVQRARKIDEKGSAALRKAAESGQVPLARAAAVVDLPKSEQLAAATAKPPATEPESESDGEPEADEAERLEAALREHDAAVERVLGGAGASELKRQAAEIASLKTSRDEFMNGKAAMTKLLQAEQRKVERLGKKVKALEAENESLRKRLAEKAAA
jgi:ParB/Sulfiredoxin domain